MNFRKLLLPVAALVLTTMTLSACVPTETNSTGHNNNMTTSTPPPVSTANHNTEMDEEMDEMMMEVIPALSADEAAKYTNNLPLSERIALAEELAMHMPKDGLVQMKAMFPDLAKTTEIENDDPRNMMMAGLETWYYSAEADVTIAICAEANSPLHVFSGDNPSQGEVDEAIEMMHEMMEDMMMMEAPIPEAPIPEASTTSYGEPKYITYTQSHNDSIIGKSPTVLFFHADWCPTCRTIESNINDELASFPAGTQILKVNFDKETKLKQDYEVFVQSTLIVLDSAGNVVKKLAAPSNKELIAAIKTSL